MLGCPCRYRGVVATKPDDPNMTRNLTMMRRALPSLFLLSFMWLAACCTPQTAPATATTAEATTTADLTKPVADATTSPPDKESGGEVTRAAEDCTPPAPKACCRAMTPECLACVDAAKAEQKAFEARCPNVHVTPPAVESRQVVGVDCTKRPEPIMCCMAETPECQACRDRADRADKNWQATCGPAGFAPPDITYDCSKPAPQTPCCRALLPKCTQCVEENRRAAEEYALVCPPK